MTIGAITLNDVMLDLSYLLGETSIPNPSPVDRQAFIQRTLERAYRAYDFDFASAAVTLALVSGNASLPSDTGLDKHLDIRVVGAGTSPSNDNVFTKIEYSQKDNFGQGDYRYWTDGAPGSYVIHTTETTKPYVSVRYTQIAPTINASIATPFPSSMCLARGALVYYRQAEDPQADVSQLEALFQRELEEIISTQIRNQADRPAVTRQQVMSTFTGDVDVNPPTAV